MDESWKKLVNYEKYQIVKSRLDYQLVDSESSKNEINNSYNSLYSLVHTICHSSLSFQLIFTQKMLPKGYVIKRNVLKVQGTARKRRLNKTWNSEGNCLMLTRKVVRRADIELGTKKGWHHGREQLLQMLL